MKTKRLTLHTKTTARFTIMLLTFFAIEANGDEKIAVNYDDHMAPIFRKHCFQCHGESKQEAGLNLASFATSIKGGSALSQLNFGIDGFEFTAGIVDSHLPVDAALSGVDIV